MPTNILMPALSPTMEKGNLARWLKKEGDQIKSGDVIAEIETDKATMEYEAVEDGTLAKIVVPEGTQDVAVNSVIAVLAGEGEDVKAAASAAKTASPQKAAEKKSDGSSTAAQPSPQKAEPAAIAPPRAQPSQTIEVAPPARGNRVFSSPLARRLAKEASIDLNRVQGSGPHGRIIARDIEQAKTGKGLRAPGVAPAGGAVIAPAMSDAQVRALYAADDRTAPDRLDTNHPSLLRDDGLRHRPADSRARGDQCRRAKDQRRQAGLQAFRQ